MFHTRASVTMLICLVTLSTLAWAQNHAKLADVAFAQGNFYEAIDHYKQALRSRPSFALYVNLGHCYTRLEQWPDAVESYEAAVELNSESVTADIWRFLGQAEYSSGEFQRAMDAFAKAASLEPDNHDSIWIARCMIELEQWIRAQSFLFHHLQQNPQNTEPLELLAHIFSQQENWPSAIEVYEELLAIAPDRTRSRIALAKVLTITGRNQQAIDTLEFAWRVDRTFGAQINRLLADLYLAEGMPQEAAACYARLVTMLDSPSSEDYYRLGVAYFQAGELTSAESTFRLVRNADPGNFKADLYLGHIAVERGNLDEAQKHYKAAIEHNPSSAESFVALANIQMESRRYPDAAANFAKAVQLGGDRPQVYYNQVLALMYQPNSNKAKAALKKALAEYPSDKQLRRLLDQYIKQTTLTQADG